MGSVYEGAIRMKYMVRTTEIKDFVGSDNILKRQDEMNSLDVIGYELHTFAISNGWIVTVWSEKPEPEKAWWRRIF